MSNQFTDIANVAAENADLTQEQSFTKALAAEGPAMLRLRSYIELGVHDSKNKANKPSVTCYFLFELLHPKHMLEDSEGNKYPDTVSIRLPYGKTGKSMYRKLFKKMNYSGKYTHFSQMIGDAPFLGTLSHNTVEKKTYVNLNKDGEWNIGSPVVVDPMTSKERRVPIPEMQGDGQLFLWENPGMTEEMIKTMWESIFIDGTYEKDGQELSKNWIQDFIRSNNDWEGSATQSAVENTIEVETTKTDIPEDAKEPEDELDPLAILDL